MKLNTLNDGKKNHKQTSIPKVNIYAWQSLIKVFDVLCLWLNWINKSGTNPHNELTDIMNIFEWTRLIFPKCSFPCKTAHRRQLHMIPSFIVLFVQCDVATKKISDLKLCMNKKGKQKLPHRQTSSKIVHFPTLKKILYLHPRHIWKIYVQLFDWNRFEDCALVLWFVEQSTVTYICHQVNNHESNHSLS